MNTNPQQELRRQIRATGLLMAKGWTPRGDWRFSSPSGTLHDLSAADLDLLPRIEREKLFLVD